MVRTARVERRAADGAGVLAGEILGDRQLRPTDPTTDGAFVAGVGGPAFGIVIRTCRVTVMTGVVLPTARKPDRDHVPRAVVVGTPGLLVQLDASNRGRIGSHGRSDSGARHQRVDRSRRPLQKTYDGIKWF